MAPLTRERTARHERSADDAPIIFHQVAHEYVCPDCGTKVVPTDDPCPSLAACHECPGPAAHDPVVG